jgi:hypothetical protein
MPVTQREKLEMNRAEPLKSRAPAGVGPTVHDDRVQSGVASQNLPRCSGSRVSVKNALNVGLEACKHKLVYFCR